MNPSRSYTPSEIESECIWKIKEIVNRGNSAEVKRTKDGGFVVYEVVKSKR